MQVLLMDMKWWAGPSYIHIHNTFKNAEKKNISEKKIGILLFQKHFMSIDIIRNNNKTPLHGTDLPWKGDFCTDLVPRAGGHGMLLTVLQDKLSIWHDRKSYSSKRETVLSGKMDELLYWLREEH